MTCARAEYEVHYIDKQTTMVEQQRVATSATCAWCRQTDFIAGNGGSHRYGRAPTRGHSASGVPLNKRYSPLSVLDLKENNYGKCAHLFARTSLWKLHHQPQAKERRPAASFFFRSQEDGNRIFRIVDQVGQIR
mmetsp:Transcript_38996/g.96877  ORF Transcript_38996/g.96877 Transcript_38996/m.96877 type:complete len:134 (+) Transcript_38996:391-792(+)